LISNSRASAPTEHAIAVEVGALPGDGEAAVGQRDRRGFEAPAAGVDVRLRHLAHAVAGGVEALEEDVAARKTPRGIGVAVPGDHEAAADQDGDHRLRRGRGDARGQAVPAHQDRRAAALRGIHVAVAHFAPGDDVAVRGGGDARAERSAHASVHLRRAGGNPVRVGGAHVHLAAAPPGDGEGAVAQCRHLRHGRVKARAGKQDFGAGVACGVHHPVGDARAGAVGAGIGHYRTSARQGRHRRRALGRGVGA